MPVYLHVIYVLWFIVICDMHDSELQIWDFRVTRVRARGPTESWGWRALLRHIDQRVDSVTASSGYYVLEWYFGELTKLMLTVLRVMCFRYQWWPREGTGLIRTHTWDFMYFDLGRCFVKQRHDTMTFMNEWVCKNVFENAKNCFKFLRCYTS